MKMNKNAVKKGTYKGYNYIVKKLQGTSSLQNHWFNGYVEIPKGHKLYNVHYEDLYSLEVHGGLTFSRTVDDKYWLGFDTARYGDNPIKCDEVYVEKELESLIDQIEVQFGDVTMDKFIRVTDNEGHEFIININKIAKMYYGWNLLYLDGEEIRLDSESAERLRKVLVGDE